MQMVKKLNEKGIWKCNLSSLLNENKTTIVP